MFGAGSAIETIIGKSAEVTGDIIARGSIRVDGKVSGHIKSGESVTIGETAAVKGDIEGKNIVIGGKVSGDIIAHAKLEILSTAELYGDIKTPKLMIAEGVIFDGTCEMEKAVQEASTAKK